MTAYRSNSRNIIGTAPDGSVLYATKNYGIDRGTKPSAPEPEPIEACYCVQYFDEDGSLHTDWVTAISPADAWERLQARDANACHYEAYHIEINLD